MLKVEQNYGMWHHIFTYFELLNIILCEHFVFKNVELSHFQAQKRKVY